MPGYNAAFDLQILNQINGTRSNGIGSLPSVPRLFGLNFQAVSVGQKYAGELRLGLTRCAPHPVQPLTPVVWSVRQQAEDGEIGCQVASGALPGAVMPSIHMRLADAARLRWQGAGEKLPGYLG